MKMMVKRWMHVLFGHGRRIDMHRCEVCQGGIDPRGGYVLAHHFPGRFNVRWYMGFASPDPVYGTVMCLPIPINFVYGFLKGRVYLRIGLGFVINISQLHTRQDLRRVNGWVAQILTWHRLHLMTLEIWRVNIFLPRIRHEDPGN